MSNPVNVPDWLPAEWSAGTGHEPAAEVVLFRLGVAFAIGITVAFVGKRARGPAADLNPGFTTTLTLLTLLVALVTLVIGNSVARAFGLVGALSIVRFRTVVEDTRDTVFVIFAVAAGMAVGSGFTAAAVVSLPVVAGAAFLLRYWLNPPGLFGTLTVRLRAGVEAQAVRQVVGKHLISCRLTGITPKKEDAVELTFRGSARDDLRAMECLKELGQIEGVQVEGWQVR